MVSNSMSAVIAELRRQRAASFARSRETVVQQRKRYEDVMARYPVSTDMAVEHEVLGGVMGERLTGRWAHPDRHILYFHGGGYSLCSPRTHRELAARIGRAAGATVHVPDYRLAPECPFPAALDDALAAYRGLLSAVVQNSGQIAIAGDSAGGGLALCRLGALRDRACPMPASACLLSPWLDLTLRHSAALAVRLNDPILTVDRLRDAVSLYAGDHDPAQDSISPVTASLAGLPPILIQVGSAEAFVGEAAHFRDRAAEANAPIQVDIWANMIHVWHAFPQTPEAIEATDAIGAFMHDLWPPGDSPSND